VTDTLERYDLTIIGCSLDSVQMEPCKMGDWVHFDHHRTKMAAAERKIEALENKLSDSRIKATKKSYDEFMSALGSMAETTRTRLTRMHSQTSDALSNGELPKFDTYAEMAELHAKLEALLHALEAREIVEREHSKVDDQLRAWAQRMTREIVAFTPASPSRNEHYLAWLGDIMRGAQSRFPDL
jgi:hypothetical protein